MRNIIKIIAFTIIALSIGAITGCTDFPDEYAVDASVGEIRMKDDAKLSEDGKSYTATVLVDFDIRENTFNKISSALVYIDGAEYDVTGQLDPNTGGTAEIPCTFEVYRSVSVTATMNISTHSFENVANLQSPSFANNVRLSTGNADGITPCSAVLHVDANYPWLIGNQNLYMLVSQNEFNVPVNAKIDDFNGQVLRCSFRYGPDYYSYDIDCKVKDLNANTSYYYQLVRLDPYSKIVFAGEVKSFKTAETTAKINTSIGNLGLTSATINITFDSGNLNGLNTSDWNIVWYIGVSQNALQAHTRSSRIGSPNTFNGLNAKSKYYYRCDFYIGKGLMCSSGIKEFTTSESTASVTVTQNELFDTYAKIRVSLDKGNTTNIISSSGSKYASVKIFCGESMNNMLLKGTTGAYSSDTFDFRINDLLESKKYFYKVCYYSGESVLASSEVLTFTTYKSSVIQNLGSLEIDTWTTSSSGNKQYNINARNGSVLAFDYSIDPGRNSLDASLTGAANVSLLDACSSSSDWKTGSIYYVFTKEGAYTLTLNYSANKYGHIKVPEIKFIY